ncbi:ABC-2 type transport system ATP-binding protein [Breznakia sp. PF5-3]|uniref:ABC transporter ATP-binding protein n=1 Tax=unclassified Breznakia TaxID=2623764 RepID=UPI002406BABE|nr:MULTISPECIES: ATP-binding cassette domain-containing protein [unclassified Breznakia]MDF9823998.1 ABC-2 type transport system ATP-binding protein [Breznakia sp. PM6-1]MDF9834797.1 ABC-2 type transport system ATP-binding protein [Breznakia sp. PF5-3]MDF9838065.1 ABC-2 type transport system ATP-binding protein [Breznakia sp. PFB2-8]MDF9860051.1 ABC-2 type transport system ATP-binding protein [Breznakia sp. PH5-24]
MSNYILETDGLTKQFGKKKAVDKVDMHVKEGEIYGFIGRNGAGKTTFLKMIANLLHKSDGEIKLFGSTDLSKSRHKIGVLIENPGLYPAMSAYDNLKMKCMMLGIKDTDKKIKELLELVGLEKVAKKKTKNFSLGMKQRLGLAITLINDPQLLLLDEPINGLDPQGIVEIREILLKLQERGMTIIISSHILEELGKIANRYGVIASGQLVKELTRDQLEELSKNSIQVVVDDVAESVRVLKKLNITEYEYHENVFNIYDTEIDRAKLNSTLVVNGVLVSSIFEQNESVEDMFIEMMGGANYV